MSWKNILYLHTQNFRLSEHFLCKYFPVSPIKLFPYWSHASCITFRKTYAKKLTLASPKTLTKKRERRTRKMKGNCRAFCVLRKCKRKRKKKKKKKKNTARKKHGRQVKSHLFGFQWLIIFAKSSILDTEWKVSVFGVFLVRVFLNVQSKSRRIRARIRALFYAVRCLTGFWIRPCTNT